jgi:hypothetical protein
MLRERWMEARREMCGEGEALRRAWDRGSEVRMSVVEV